ncbi:hypothetical protein [Helicobacter pullorum]
MIDKLAGGGGKETNKKKQELQKKQFQIKVIFLWFAMKNTIMLKKICFLALRDKMRI